MYLPKRKNASPLLLKSQSINPNIYAWLLYLHNLTNCKTIINLAYILSYVAHMYNNDRHIFSKQANSWSCQSDSDSDSFYLTFSITTAITLNVYINKRNKKWGKKIHIHVHTCKSLVALRHKKLEKRFGTFLGTTSLRSVQRAVSRRHSTVVKKDVTKKWMRRITCYFTKLPLAQFK